MTRLLALLGISLFCFGSSASQWTQPRLVDSTTIDNQAFPLIAVGPQRQIAVACSEGVAHERRVILYLSTSNGTRFARSVVVEYPIPDPNFGGMVVRRPDGLAFDSSGNIYMFWRAEFRDELGLPLSTIFNLAKSADAGASFQMVWTKQQTYGIPLTSQISRCPLIVDKERNIHIVWDSSARSYPDYFKCIYTSFADGGASGRYDFEMPKPPNHVAENMELDIALSDSTLHFVVNRKVSNPPPNYTSSFKLYYTRISQLMHNPPTLIPVDTTVGTAPCFGLLSSGQMAILYGSGNTSDYSDTVLTARLIGDSLSSPFRLTSKNSTTHTPKILRSCLGSNFLVFGYGSYLQETGTAFYQFSDIHQAALDSAFFVGHRDPDFALDSLGGKYLVMVGPNGKISFSRKDVVSSVRGADALPGDFSLEQNYPNPFNASTTIRFNLTTSVFTSLNVYDLVGRHVATLTNEQKHSGAHRITWAADNAATGVYFYTLRSGGFVQTKKALLLR